MIAEYRFLCLLKKFLKIYEKGRLPNWREKVEKGKKHAEIDKFSIS